MINKKWPCCNYTCTVGETFWERKNLTVAGNRGSCEEFWEHVVSLSQGGFVDGCSPARQASQSLTAPDNHFVLTHTHTQTQGFWLFLLFLLWKPMSAVTDSSILMRSLCSLHQYNQVGRSQVASGYFSDWGMSGWLTANGKPTWRITHVAFTHSVQLNASSHTDYCMEPSIRSLSWPTEEFGCFSGVQQCVVHGWVGLHSLGYNIQFIHTIFRAPCITHKPQNILPKIIWFIQVMVQLCFKLYLPAQESKCMPPGIKFCVWGGIKPLFVHTFAARL